MGMFDTIAVKDQLIKPLVDKDIFEAIQKDVEDSFLSFQTKDLENCLFYYKIDEDKKLMQQKYGFVEDETEFLGGRSEFQEATHDTRTTYIEFYDHLGCVGEDSVFITFKAHIVKGEMQDLSVFKIERTNIKEQQEATKKFQERWEKIRSTPEWKLRDFLNNIEWKINRLFYPISRKYSSFKTFLRNKAESKFPDEDTSSR
jgi:hypothetical protein